MNCGTIPKHALRKRTGWRRKQRHRATQFLYETCFYRSFGATTAYVEENPPRLLLAIGFAPVAAVSLAQLAAPAAVQVLVYPCHFFALDVRSAVARTGDPS